MAVSTTFIAGTGEVKRNLMVMYANVGTGEIPSWEALGVKVEDSSIEYNIESEKATDILGTTTTTIKSTQPVQSFDGMSIRKESKLAQKLFDIMYKKDYPKLQEFEILIAYGFVGAEGSFAAEKHVGCTIDVKSIGGSGTLDMPIDVNLSNNCTYGTVDKLLPASEVKFTADTGVGA